MDEDVTILSEVMEPQEAKKRLKWYEERFGPYIERRGLQNWRNLFRKPTLYEWTILFMILMALFIAWAYQRDISICREYIEQDKIKWDEITNGTGSLQRNQEPNYSISLDSLETLINGTDT